MNRAPSGPARPHRRACRSGDPGTPGRTRRRRSAAGRPAQAFHAQLVGVCRLVLEGRHLARERGDLRENRLQCEGAGHQRVEAALLERVVRRGVERQVVAEVMAELDAPRDVVELQLVVDQRDVLQKADIVVQFGFYVVVARADPQLPLFGESVADVAVRGVAGVLAGGIAVHLHAAQHHIEFAVGGAIEVVQAGDVGDVAHVVGEAQFIGGDLIIQVDAEDFVGAGKRLAILVRPVPELLVHGEEIDIAELRLPGPVRADVLDVAVDPAGVVAEILAVLEFGVDGGTCRYRRRYPAAGPGRRRRRSAGTGPGSWPWYRAASCR